MQFAKQLDQIELRFEELSQQLADPDIMSDGDRYRKIAKAHSDLSEMVAKYREWKRIEDDLQPEPVRLDGLRLFDAVAGNVRGVVEAREQRRVGGHEGLHLAHAGLGARPAQRLLRRARQLAEIAHVSAGGRS